MLVARLNSHCAQSAAGRSECVPTAAHCCHTVRLNDALTPCAVPTVTSRYERLAYSSLAPTLWMPATLLSQIHLDSVTNLLPNTHVGVGYGGPGPGSLDSALLASSSSTFLPFSPLSHRMRSIRGSASDKHTITSYKQAAELLTVCVSSRCSGAVGCHHARLFLSPYIPQAATQQRNMAATRLNQSSSRSHLLVQLVGVWKGPFS